MHVDVWNCGCVLRFGIEGERFDSQTMTGTPDTTGIVNMYVEINNPKQHVCIRARSYCTVVAHVTATEK